GHEAVERANEYFISTMNAYSQTRPDLRLLFIDIFTKFDDVRANPAEYGLTKATISALADTSLTNITFTGPGADYMFWDQYHGTSKLNKLLAAWRLDVLTNSALEKLDITIADG